MEQTGDTEERIIRRGDHPADELLRHSNLDPDPTVQDNLHKLPVSDEEIATVEAFLGLQAAMILGDTKSNRRKAS